MPTPGAPQKDEVLIKAMLQGLTVAHYQPEKIDDTFSKRVFDLYLKHLDYNKKFLLQSDVAQLRNYQTAIDDQVKAGTHEFLDLSTKLMDQRMKEVQGCTARFWLKPFDFTKEESFETDSDKTTFAADKAAQREEWRKYLKYETLSRVSEMMDEQAKPKRKPRRQLPLSAKPPIVATAASPYRTPAEMEAEARKRVLKYFDDQFQDMMQTDANERLALTPTPLPIPTTRTPSTLPPATKTDFDDEMTGRFEGIGATLQEKEGQI